jgi:hypothetical protein
MLYACYCFNTNTALTNLSAGEFNNPYSLSLLTFATGVAQLTGYALEIASGTGAHMELFAPVIPTRSSAQSHSVTLTSHHFYTIRLFPD